jgi:hypothetical protein
VTNLKVTMRTVSVSTKADVLVWVSVLVSSNTTSWDLGYLSCNIGKWKAFLDVESSPLRQGCSDVRVTAILDWSNEAFVDPSPVTHDSQLIKRTQFSVPV